MLQLYALFFYVNRIFNWFPNLFVYKNMTDETAMTLFDAAKLDVKGSLYYVLLITWNIVDGIIQTKKHTTNYPNSFASQYLNEHIL